MKSGLWERYWNLSPLERAWMIAAAETEASLQQVVDFVASLEVKE